MTKPLAIAIDGPAGAGKSTIARILATFGIGISATSSAPSHIAEDGAQWNDLVFILHSCPWGQLQKALEEIARISCVAAEPRVLRIEHLLPQS